MGSDEAALRNELNASRKRYQEAVHHLRAAEAVLHTVGAGHPDGTQALRNANRELSLANEDFHRALKNFTESILRRR